MRPGHLHGESGLLVDQAELFRALVPSRQVDGKAQRRQLGDGPREIRNIPRIAAGGVDRDRGVLAVLQRRPHQARQLGIGADFQENPGAGTMHRLDLAHEVDRARELGREELAGLLGSDVRRFLTPLGASNWGEDPWTGGAYSHARVGQAHQRAVLAAPLEDRLFFAGEACSKPDFSTAHGAYRTGLAAAEQVLAVRRQA